ncbi:MAG: glutathione S-transferase N-terminal domain-containing protein [Gammaproteobacteria bacterium]|nr:glutathione S-transferase N-terminal domain-containing protein [Gammaproteobacteria bacterium]
MGAVANRRSVMILFSSSTDPLSHCARLVLAEKHITFDVVDVDQEGQQAELADVNPYGDVPTLVDRDLVVYDVQILSEYLDERFPHPPLMPVDPVSRATARLGLHRVFKDWYSLLPDVESEDKRLAAKAKKELRDVIASSADIFAAKPFFLSDDMTLVDCAIAPILWRLPAYRIDLPRQAKVIEQYAERIFSRDSFQSCLTEAEQEMRL